MKALVDQYQDFLKLLVYAKMQFVLFRKSAHAAEERLTMPL